MADVEEDSMDLETLQAQIDMSMAFTHDLVSGWMKASKAKLPSSSSANDDRELEEYMRKPPRLGVGASAPESTGVLSRETAKLRNKLVGNSKKRAREEEDALGSSSANAASQPIIISDDEEDSRARVITKKARIDPFAPKTKENKKKGKADSVQALPSAPPAASPSKKAAAQEASTTGPLPQDIASKGAVVEDGEGPSTPKKKKKKKKHKAHSDGAGDPQSIASAPREPASMPVSGKHGTEASAAPGVSEPSLSAKLPIPVSTKAPSPKLALNDAPSSQPQNPATPVRPPSAAPQSSPLRLDPFGKPLLNLSGPPPVADEEQSASPKKKRKRKKKKKQAVSAPDVAANPVEPDGQDEDEDE
ncbi:hypothetical protein L226DRAFT_565546 [Lentinus tigrinus ALCF2SS1-7]|uniref:Uncharacterized protein n=1 Tax=Lentinus tigrinus ALCF2SS1-6 TaxID=1328759 RepID=A0A5C2SSA4_9APHY|nr:hypothetical protein L227DRAFT_2957 [Lentinus tigrinus ALCF2SS1-6]RPD80699.1 hypothetical protein L226DRAFT_565546 [Lentinus tigrinus ALCF2SS1-7]